MNFDEDHKKALEICESQNIGINLNEIYETIKDYGSLIKKENFDEKYNIGISDIYSSRNDKSLNSHKYQQI